MIVLRLRHYTESGPPEEVTIDKRVERRLQYLRDQWFGDALHKVHRDPRTGEVYAVPTGEVWTAPAPRPPRAEPAPRKPRQTAPAPRPDAPSAEPGEEARPHRRSGPRGGLKLE